MIHICFQILSKIGLIPYYFKLFKIIYQLIRYYNKIILIGWSKSQPSFTKNPELTLMKAFVLDEVVNV